MKLLTLPEVADECRAPLSTARWWCTIGKLRSIKVGRRRLVRREDLDQFLQECALPEGVGVDKAGDR
jgi:excisionase family DNA binding protein